MTFCLLLVHPTSLFLISCAWATNVVNPLDFFLACVVTHLSKFVFGAVT